MLKYRYRFHPDEYALGENEKFYSDMEARGWRLVKRGSTLSKFEPCEPSSARYRIEVVSPEFLGETELSDEQIMVYADCGWEYVASYSMLHIFRAPAGSDAPEFYTDPRQQAATLKKLRRSYLLAWLPIVIMLALWLSMAAAMRGDVGAVLREGMAELQRRWVTVTTMYIMVYTTLAYAIYSMIRGAVSISRTYRRMKRGIPLDHDPKGKQILHRIVKHTTSAVMVICVALTAWQLSVGYEKYDLPMEADGPYLLLSDLGYEGERSTPFYSDDGSDVEHVKSLLAEFWLTREYIDLPSGKQVWMDQDLYRLRYPDMAENFAHTLMETAIFIRDPENFRSVKVPGLDAVWVGGMEIVAIKDDLAVYVVCSSEVYDNSGMIEKVLPALAEKWA